MPLTQRTAGSFPRAILSKVLLPRQQSGVNKATGNTPGKGWNKMCAALAYREDSVATFRSIVASFILYLERWTLLRLSRNKIRAD